MGAKPAVRLADRPLVHIALVAALAALAYSNTFSVPFHFDDFSNIVENPIVKDLGYFAAPSTAAPTADYALFVSRYMGYLSFALNYKAAGLDVAGYHAVNLAVHVANAMLLYWLVVVTFCAPRLAASRTAPHSKSIAFFTAAFFVLHPVQTQAVTYVVQRFASLATLFYLSSLLFYARSRLSDEKAAGAAWYGLSLASAVIAAKTKEISITLPLVVAAYEFMFFTGQTARRLLRLAPFLFIAAVIPLTLLAVGYSGGLVVDVGRASDLGSWLSRHDYALTQLRVVCTYIRLLFLPLNQNLDYDYPISRSFTPEIALAALFLALVFGSAVLLFRRARKSDASFRLVSFGIFWFFITLSVESGAAPIIDVIFEHRVYLPSVGALLAVVAGIFAFHARAGKGYRRLLVSCLAAMALLFGIASYERNSAWGTGVALWQDVVEKSPRKFRGHHNLGTAYALDGLTDRAIEQYEAAIALKPYAMAHRELGNIYRKKGDFNEAMEHLKAAVKLKPDYAEAYNDIGLLYLDRGLPDDAVKYFRASVDLQPGSADGYGNIGVAFETKGMADKAREYYLAAIKADPASAGAYINLGRLYKAQGLIDEAIKQYLAAVGLRPDIPEAHNNLGNAYAAKGLTDNAMAHYNEALRLKPDFVEAHFNLALLYEHVGKKEEAAAEYRKVLALVPGSRDAELRLDSLTK
jgi:tetratricopeptide (TPR) repeat protein